MDNHWLILFVFLIPNPLWLWILWLYYLAVMNLKAVRDKHGLHWLAKVMGYPMLYLGLLIDFRCQVIECTVLFFEVPKETLVTARLQRHANRGTGWRKSLAVWFGESLLNDFDPSGNHLD